MIHLDNFIDRVKYRFGIFKLGSGLALLVSSFPFFFFYSNLSRLRFPRRQKNRTKSYGYLIQHEFDPESLSFYSNFAIPNFEAPLLSFNRRFASMAPLSVSLLTSLDWFALHRKFNPNSTWNGFAPYARLTRIDSPFAYVVVFLIDSIVSLRR